jgi:chromosome segregation protein
MHIRRLELQGFKSFKDKTVIHFDDGITGIVGPNGCGKSNVVDAFFWVMGEQNARHLRGQSMDDLIFSGADKAPPASYAEVTLILDMPAEVAGPNAPAGASCSETLATHPTREVAITRKLYRTGESDYFLNKTPCRLRDIQELFMDTGVGARGYSIIQQGQIAKIVQAKPEDRRTMIEEVAGIVKYKARRRESMRKLEGTQQNLLRVTDVINELENQKRQMERQADKARKYKEWKDRLQSIELSFNAMRWEDLSNRLNLLDQEIEMLNTEDLALSTARESAETQIAQKRMELTQASKIAEEFQQKWMDSGTRLNNAENDLKYSQKNLDDLKTSFLQLEQNSEEERVMVQELSAQHEALELESSTIEEQFVNAESLKQQQETLALEKKREAEQTESTMEAARKRLFQAGSELEKAKSAANFAQMRIAEMEASFARLQSERAEREEFLSSANQEKVEASLRTEEAKAESAQWEAKTKELAQLLNERNIELQAARKEMAQLNSEIARIRTTLKTLEDQKSRHEDASKGVKAVFQNILAAREDLKASVHGTLSDVLRVEKGMETALETALGRSLELVITKDGNIPLELSRALKEGSLGRASFANLDQLNQAPASVAAFHCPEQFAADTLGALRSFVSATEGSLDGVSALLDALLSSVVAVKTVETAAQLSKEFPDFTFVTLGGELLRGGWLMEGGDQSSVSGSLVGRNREILELQEKLQEFSLKIDEAQARIHSLETDLTNLGSEKKSAEEQFRAAQSRLSQLASEEGSLTARLQEAQRAMAKILQEEERLNAEKERLEESEKEARVNSFALETEKGALEVEVASLSSKLAEARKIYEEVQTQLMDARVKAANISDQRNSLATRLRQNQNALDQHKNRIESMLEQARRKQEESEATNLRIIEIQSQLEGLRTEMVDAEANFRAAKERYDILNNEVEEQRTAAQLHSTKEREVKDSLMNKRLDHQKATTDRELLSGNTLEYWGIVLAEFCIMPETIEQVQILRQKGDEYISETRNEVTLLREKIRKLGDVNPAAVEEYEAIVDRFNLLSTQKSDLEKAMADLQSTVDRINQISKDRFERAFAEVNNHFKRVFPVIFGGGHAHLTLTNPEDMLETGVDITAQPPGKKAQNINLLSGGEKTLTAISLLFSIFLVKPSPFCLLDEVDAPLDDANIGRFNALLREMAKRSQFIIITHNKRTMELNDKLYGVTMEDAGISKMVSIQLSASA